jgi:hypothetical protein
MQGGRRDYAIGQVGHLGSRHTAHSLCHLPVKRDLYQHSIGGVVNLAFLNQIDHLGQGDARKGNLFASRGSIFNPGMGSRRETSIVEEVTDDCVRISDGAGY